MWSGHSCPLPLTLLSILMLNFSAPSAAVLLVLSG